MADRNYYVICEDGCRFEAMTKEQILEAIAEATGNTPTGIDNAFITKIKELNTGGNLSFWVGTSAQYNAIEERDPSVIYILNDESTLGDLSALVADMKTTLDNHSLQLNASATLVSSLNSSVSNLNTQIVKTYKRTSLSSTAVAIPYKASLDPTNIYTSSSSLNGVMLEIHWKFRDVPINSTGGGAVEDISATYITRMKAATNMGCDFVFLMQQNKVNYVRFGLDSTGKKLQGNIFFETNALSNNTGSSNEPGVQVTNVYKITT